MLTRRMSISPSLSPRSKKTMGSKAGGVWTVMASGMPSASASVGSKRRQFSSWSMEKAMPAMSLHGR